MAEEKISEEFIKALPKTDLHLHLDGSLRIGTLIELAKGFEVQLPSYTEEGLRELVLKDRYQNLGEYLTGFQYTVGVLQRELALERCAYELAGVSRCRGSKTGTNGTITLPALSRRVGSAASVGGRHEIFRLPVCAITASKFSATFKPRNDGLIRVRCYRMRNRGVRLGWGRVWKRPKPHV